MGKNLNASETSIRRMLDEIRGAIGRCSASEKDTYEALATEAEGWKMRLEELSNDILEDDREAE